MNEELDSIQELTVETLQTCFLLNFNTMDVDRVVHSTRACCYVLQINIIFYMIKFLHYR